MIVGPFQEIDEGSTTMAERDSMTIEQVVRKVMSDEHADVLRESLGLLARELMGGSRRGAVRRRTSQAG